MNHDIEEEIGMKINKIELIDKRTSDNDTRYIYKVKTDIGKYCLKLQHNSFTTLKRVNKTADLIEKYNEMGIYSPKYLILSNGTYSTIINRGEVSFVMWLEEFSKFDVAKDDSKIVETTEFQLQIIDYLGTISTGLKAFDFPFKSPYIMFESFDNSTTTDEYEQYFVDIYSQLKDDKHIHQANLEYVKGFFYKTRSRIKTKYSELPESVFQSDLQNGNLLLSDNTFRGLIDFNLAGKEKVITYFINETANQEKSQIGEKWISEEYISKHLTIFKMKLKQFNNQYKLNELEEELFEDLYKVIVPFKYYPLTEIKGYYNLHEYNEVNYRIFWMKRIIDNPLNLI